MVIETVDDLVEHIADLCGVYGACKAAAEGKEQCNENGSTCCRVGFAIEMKERIYKALENDQKLLTINITKS